MRVVRQATFFTPSTPRGTFVVNAPFMFNDDDAACRRRNSTRTSRPLQKMMKNRSFLHLFPPPLLSKLVTMSSEADHIPSSPHSNGDAGMRLAGSRLSSSSAVSSPLSYPHNSQSSTGSDPKSARSTSALPRQLAPRNDLGDNLSRLYANINGSEGDPVSFPFLSFPLFFFLIQRLLFSSLPDKLINIFFFSPPVDPIHACE